MVLLHRFCFWFSVRLGAIIVGVLTMMQSCFWLMLCILALENTDIASNKMRWLLDDLKIKNAYLEEIADDPKCLLIVAATFFSVLLLSSLLLIIGAFQCKHVLVYPFICLFGMYVLFLVTQDILLMLHFKREDVPLGILIMLCNLGGFIILYFLYMWGCVISFLQIIKELQRQILIREHIQVQRHLLSKQHNAIVVKHRF